MPCVSAPKKRKKDQRDDFFSLLFLIVAVAFFIGMDFYFYSAKMSANKAASATVSDSVSKESGAYDGRKAAFLVPVGNPVEEPVVYSFDDSNPDPQCVFYPGQKNVLYGQTVRMMWDCINADKCEIEGIGQVSSSNTKGIEVIPDRSGTYTLNCYKGTEKKSFSAEISVFEFTIKELSPSEAEME